VSRVITEATRTAAWLGPGEPDRRASAVRVFAGAPFIAIYDFTNNEPVVIPLLA
jgi:hypothetical protein